MESHLGKWAIGRSIGEDIHGRVLPVNIQFYTVGEEKDGGIEEINLGPYFAKLL